MVLYYTLNSSGFRDVYIVAGGPHYLQIDLAEAAVDIRFAEAGKRNIQLSEIDVKQLALIGFFRKVPGWNLYAGNRTLTCGDELVHALRSTQSRLSIDEIFKLLEGALTRHRPIL